MRIKNSVRDLLSAIGLKPHGGSAFDAASYWESRYAAGGNSGEGSYGSLAAFKAETINGLLKRFSLASAVEFGCGDGHQLSLINYPRYVGLDVSPAAIAICVRRFESDLTKSFFLYEPRAFRDGAGVFRSDVALSLDVIYHIVSDSVFEMYMSHLSDAASRVLIIYSTDVDRRDSDHVRHRSFSKWMKSNRPEFRLEATVPNPFPGTGEKQSDAGFYVYERV